MNFHFDVYVLIACCLISLATRKQPENNTVLYLKYFPAFLMITLAVEIIGVWLGHRHINNTLIYNLYSVFEFWFFLHFFQQLDIGPSGKKWIPAIKITLPLLCLINIVLFQGLHNFHTYTYLLGCVTMDVFAIMYFLQLFRGEERIKLLKTPSFWIATGILFFFSASMSFLGILNYASTLPLAVTVSLVNLLVLVSTFFYILLIIAFVCKLPVPKFTRSS